MVRFGTGAEAGVLGLDKIADFHAFLGVRARTQPCVGADHAAGAELCAFEVGKGADHASFTDMTAGANDDMGVDDDVALDDGISRQEHGFRCDHGDAAFHRGVTKAALQGGFGAGEVNPVIDPHDFILRNHDVTDLLSIGNGKPDNVCQIIFAFGIVIGDARQPVKQGRCADRHDATIAKGDPALLGGRVLMFHDAGDAAILVRHQPAIPCRICRLEPGDGDGRT